MCDNVAAFKDRLRRILTRASKADLLAMMSPEERAALAALSPTLTVYRGCYSVNSDGLSWSLSREVAQTFPTLNRYRREGDTPMLLEGRASRGRSVLLLDRDEEEVICAEVEVVASHPCAATDAAVQRGH